MAFKITKKHHKHLNNPFPSPPKSIPFIQGALSLNLQALPSHQIYSIGHDFQLNWSAKNGGFLSISHKSQPARHAWSTIPGEAFISAAAVETEVVESRGSFVIKDKDVHLICNHQTIDDIRVINESDLPSEAKDHDFPSLSDKRNGHFPLLRSFSQKFGLINRCRVRWSRLLPRKKGIVTVSSITFAANLTTPCELIEHLTESIGRPPELPEWIISGAVVGMQGGTDTVHSIWNEMQRHGVPVSAFWLQVQNPPFFKYTRSEELLLRWMELNAFTTIFRTHEEASQKGLPVCRHLFLHYQDDDRVHSLTYEQFLIGSEILVVPSSKRKQV